MYCLKREARSEREREHFSVSFNKTHDLYSYIQLLQLLFVQQRKRILIFIHTMKFEGFLLKTIQQQQKTQKKEKTENIFKTFSISFIYKHVIMNACTYTYVCVCNTLNISMREVV